MVSIIVPVYGVEDYVERLVRSALAQSYTNFELLLVDDGSRDASGEICDRLALEDPRITVFHKENGGAPVARNYAMGQAKGRYYYFADADDWMEPGLLEGLVTLAERHDASLTICGFYIDTYTSDADYVSEVKSLPDGVFDQHQFRRNAYRFFEQNLLFTPWNKLFRRDFVDSRGLLYPGTFWDDVPFSFSVLRDVDKVANTSLPYYHFIKKRSESETARYREGVFEKNEELHGIFVDLYNHWGIDDDNSKDMIARRYIDRSFVTLDNIVSPDNKGSRPSKIAAVKQFLDSPNFAASLPRARYSSLYMKLMCVPLRLGNPYLVYVEGRTISWVKRRGARIFSWLKAHR